MDNRDKPKTERYINKNKNKNENGKKSEDRDDALTDNNDDKQ